jgi:antirestriction protein ArdC
MAPVGFGPKEIDMPSLASTETPSRRTSRPDLYAEVTQRIVQDLEQGVRPWTKPWTAEHPAGPVRRPMRHNLEPYRGVNVLLLWLEAVAQGYACPIWMTFRQALELGGHVRKGEHGATVVYANRISRTETSEGGEAIERSIPFLKSYVVFNVEQVEGLPDRFHAPAPPRLDAAERIQAADAFFAATGVCVRHGGDQAYYASGPDMVRIPDFEAFADPESYYATLAHECVHWTGHPSRLDRSFPGTRRGIEAYAREELVAELGAAFLCADLGLDLAPRSDHAAYIAEWLQILGRDTRLVFAGAAHAQRAVDYLLAFQCPAPEIPA